MPYRKNIDPFRTNMKHGRRSETLKGFHGQRVKHNPKAHELSKHGSLFVTNVKHADPSETLVGFYGNFSKHIPKSK
jgi:hypothetical protein